jgi:hypothetical protein
MGRVSRRRVTDEACSTEMLIPIDYEQAHTTAAAAA